MRLEDVALLYVGKPDEIRYHIICCSLVNLNEIRRCHIICYKFTRFGRTRDSCEVLFVYWGG